MGRYIHASTLEGDARLRLFPEGRCQWCGKELPKRCTVFCPSVKVESGPFNRPYKMQVCAREYHWYWYTTPRARRLVLLRDEFTCQQCGARPTVVWPDGIERPDLSQLHADHIVPYSRGGRNHLENLQLLCAPCNLKKGTKMPEEVRG